MTDAIVKVLEEIQLGRGPYSRAQLTHAENTIDAMKELARTAIPLAQQMVRASTRGARQ